MPPRVLAVSKRGTVRTKRGTVPYVADSKSPFANERTGASRTTAVARLGSTFMGKRPSKSTPLFDGKRGKTGTGPTILPKTGHFRQKTRSFGQFSMKAHFSITDQASTKATGCLRNGRVARRGNAARSKTERSSPFENGLLKRSSLFWNGLLE